MAEPNHHDSDAPEDFDLGPRLRRPRHPATEVAEPSHHDSDAPEDVDLGPRLRRSGRPETEATEPCPMDTVPPFGPDARAVGQAALATGADALDVAPTSLPTRMLPTHP
ncbi:hypothetical protein GCM10023201_32650 [Actinomycetospora corticicola]